MKAKRLVPVSVLLPIRRDSDGELQSDSVWREFESLLACRYGGFTIGETVFGSWIDNSGQLVGDYSKPYRFAIDPIDVENVESLCESLAMAFDQQCIYVEIANSAYIVDRLNPEQSAGRYVDAMRDLAELA